MGNHVEPDSFGKRTAFAHGNNIPFLDGKGRRTVDGNVLVTLFETTVLGNVMKVITSDDNGTLHFGTEDQTLQNTSTNGNVSGKGTLLVDVIGFNGGGRCFNSQTDTAGETHRFLTLVADSTLASDKDGILRLVRFFVLIALDVFSGRTGKHGELTN